MNFKLGDYYYDFNSLKPKKVDIDNRLIIFDLHKSDTYTEKINLTTSCSEDFLFYRVVLSVDDKLYDFPEFVYESKDKNTFSWLLDTVYIQKTADFITLKQLNKRVEDLSKNICLDLDNVKICIISSDGEAIEFSPADICFHIKHEDENLILGISGLQGYEF